MAQHFTFRKVVIIAVHLQGVQGHHLQIGVVMQESLEDRLRRKKFKINMEPIVFDKLFIFQW